MCVSCLDLREDAVCQFFFFFYSIEKHDYFKSGECFIETSLLGINCNVRLAYLLKETATTA